LFSFLYMNEKLTMYNQPHTITFTEKESRAIINDEANQYSPEEVTRERKGKEVLEEFVRYVSLSKRLRV